MPRVRELTKRKYDCVANLGLKFFNVSDFLNLLPAAGAVARDAAPRGIDFFTSPRGIERGKKTKESPRINSSQSSA